jgi:hypothetical protein
VSRLGLFLCGCDPADPRIKNYSFHSVKIGKEEFLTNKRVQRARTRGLSLAWRAALRLGLTEQDRAAGKYCN